MIYNLHFPQDQGDDELEAGVVHGGGVACRGRPGPGAAGVDRCRAVLPLSSGHLRLPCRRRSSFTPAIDSGMRRLSGNEPESSPDVKIS